MNAYRVDGGEIQTVHDRIEYWTIYETSEAIELVFADTRSQAKATFIRYYGGEIEWYSRHEFEFTDPIKIKLIAKDVNRNRGVAQSDDILWTKAWDDQDWRNFNESELEFSEHYRDYPADGAT